MSVTDNHWQVQEAKQRFSELLRAAETGDFQFITRHGKEVAVLVDIDTFHTKVAPPRMTLAEWLLKGPDVPDDVANEFWGDIDGIVAARVNDIPRDTIEW